MIYAAVTKYNTEWLFPRKPIRDNGYWECRDIKGNQLGEVVRYGFIERLTGKKLSWEDEPIELK